MEDFKIMWRRDVCSWPPNTGIAEADKATKGLVHSLELLASGKLKSGIEKAFKTILDAGGNFQ